MYMCLYVHKHAIVVTGYEICLGVIAIDQESYFVLIIGIYTSVCDATHIYLNTQVHTYV